MANNFRADRVGMEIKREVNEILQKKVRDPRVQGVTITDVQIWVTCPWPRSTTRL